ncbi:hypothetical protein niasHT_012490 [Heterodera trifolii]|uniref:Uncharacterized protein n=1 Tax=Heterodera trifolii TaxID=157864 RepID=A0ABD2KVJ2_9BILA
MAEPKEVHPMEEMTEEEQRSLQSMERSLLKQLEKVRKTLASGQIKGQEEEDQVAPIMLEENEMNDDDEKPETGKKELKLETKEKGTKRKWEEEKEKTVKKVPEMEQREKEKVKCIEDVISLDSGEFYDDQAILYSPKAQFDRFGFWDSCVNTEAKRELKELKEKEKIVKNELDTPSIEKWGIRVQKLRENEKKTKEARNVLQCLLKIRERALVISDEAQIASREVQKIIEKDGKSGDEKEAKWEEEPFSNDPWKEHDFRWKTRGGRGNWRGRSEWRGRGRNGARGSWMNFTGPSTSAAWTMAPGPSTATDFPRITGGFQQN